MGLFEAVIPKMTFKFGAKNFNFIRVRLGQVKLCCDVSGEAPLGASLSAPLRARPAVTRDQAPADRSGSLPLKVSERARSHWWQADSVR